MSPRTHKTPEEFENAAGFISTARPTVHTNRSRKRNLVENKYKIAGDSWVFKSLWRSVEGNAFKRL